MSEVKKKKCRPPKPAAQAPVCQTQACKSERQKEKKKNTIHESIFVLGNNMSRLS